MFSLGRIRAPNFAQLTITTEDDPPGPDGKPSGPGRTILRFTAKGRGPGQEANYQQVYPGQLIALQQVLDLLSWLRHTAKTFWGREDGGI